MSQVVNFFLSVKQLGAKICATIIWWHLNFETIRTINLTGGWTTLKILNYFNPGEKIKLHSKANK